MDKYICVPNLNDRDKLIKTYLGHITFQGEDNVKKARISFDSNIPHNCKTFLYFC